MWLRLSALGRRALNQALRRSPSSVLDCAPEAGHLFAIGAGHTPAAETVSPFGRPAELAAFRSEHAGTVGAIAAGPCASRAVERGAGPCEHHRGAASSGDGKAERGAEIESHAATPTQPASRGATAPRAPGTNEGALVRARRRTRQHRQELDGTRPLLRALARRRQAAVRGLRGVARRAGSHCNVASVDWQAGGPPLAECDAPDDSTACEPPDYRRSRRRPPAPARAALTRASVASDGVRRQVRRPRSHTEGPSLDARRGYGFFHGDASGARCDIEQASAH